MHKPYFFLLLLLPVQLFAGDFDAVKELIRRRVSWLDKHVVFEKINSADANDVFELQTKNKQLVIKANNPNAAAVGLNWYLKNYCHRSMSHMGDNLAAVYPLPFVQEPVKINSVAQYRYALNYCTYNYTMSFYTWKDWEHELDWMALNGVNTMLVANGEEAVWQNVLRRIGYTEKEIAEYITGPAYNAWWLMGNIQGWGGPMPQTQIDARKVLVQKMIARMQSLGIEPVMPGFYGMVPGTLKNKSNAHIITQGNWGAFARPDILDPTDTAFSRIAGIFYEETKNLYGKNIHFFSGDPFHEGGISEGVDLGNAGRNIQQAMQQYFPGSIWVLQGWQDNPKKELLAKVDKSTVLIQELFGENTNNWETRKGYEGTPFIWCIVNNFGERPGIQGKLERFAAEVYRAGNSEYKQYMKGVGIMPEGINNNPVTYELLLATAWHQQQLNADDWVQQYAIARYGKYNAAISNAWKLLLQTTYSNPGYQEGPPENILCARPALKIKSVSSWGNLKKGYDTVVFAKAVKDFAKAAPLFTNSEPYKIDLINFTRQVLSNRADKAFADFVKAYNEKNMGAFEVATKHFLQLADETDALLNTHVYYRLSTYQLQALAAGNTNAEKKNNLHNAMMLITYWGENNPKEDNLHEYAYKEWAGMMQSFYKKRWEIYFDYLRKQLNNKPVTAPDFFTWEHNWAAANEAVMYEKTKWSLAQIISKVLKF
ncbi:MAG: alpha-N-acetylglucosaminidase [Panacibacter sp.]